MQKALIEMEGKDKRIFITAKKIRHYFRKMIRTMPGMGAYRNFAL